MGSRVEQAVRRAEAAVAIGATRVGDVPAAEFNASQVAIGELMELVAKQDAELAALRSNVAELEAAARCPSVATWGAHCDGERGHDGRHHAHMRDHGDLRATEYYWP